MDSRATMQSPTSEGYASDPNGFSPPASPRTRAPIRRAHTRARAPAPYTRMDAVVVDNLLGAFNREAHHTLDLMHEAAKQAIKLRAMSVDTDQFETDQSTVLALIRAGVAIVKGQMDRLPVLPLLDFFTIEDQRLVSILMRAMSMYIVSTLYDMMCCKFGRDLVSVDREDISILTVKHDRLEMTVIRLGGERPRFPLGKFPNGVYIGGHNVGEKPPPYGFFDAVNSTTLPVACGTGLGVESIARAGKTLSGHEQMYEMYIRAKSGMPPLCYCKDAKCIILPLTHNRAYSVSRFPGTVNTFVLTLTEFGAKTDETTSQVSDGKSVMWELLSLYNSWKVSL